MDGLKINLLGLPAISVLELYVISRVFVLYTTDIKDKERFPSLFQGLECLRGEYHISSIKHPGVYLFQRLIIPGIY